MTIIRPLNVLGVDGSLTAPGFAYGPVGVSTLLTNRKDGDRRLIEIRDRVRYYLRLAERNGCPYLIAVLEGPSYGSPGQIVQLGMVQAAVRMPLMEHVVPYAVVSPATLKVFATRDAQATKADMLAAARQASGLGFGDDNQVDAWWLRQMGLAAADPLTRRDMRDDQVDRLGHVLWPGLVNPYGHDVRPRLIEKCRHDMYSGKHLGRWVHPFTLDVCEKPPR